MAEPMSQQRLSEFRSRISADVWIGVTSEEAQELLAELNGSRSREHALAEEVQGLRAELQVAFGPSMYFDIQKVLDEALGTNQVDGAGLGIVADVALLAERKRAAEVERDRLRVELDANRQRWYHDDRGRTECVAGHDPDSRQCAEGGGPVLSEVEYLTQLVDIWQGLTRKAEEAEAAAKAEAGRLNRDLGELEQMVAELTAKNLELTQRAALQGSCTDEAGRYL